MGGGGCHLHTNVLTHPHPPTSKMGGGGVSLAHKCAIHPHPPTSKMGGGGGGFHLHTNVLTHPHPPTSRMEGVGVTHSHTNVLTHIHQPLKWTLNAVSHQVSLVPLSGITPAKSNPKGVFWLLWCWAWYPTLAFWISASNILLVGIPKYNGTWKNTPFWTKNVDNNRVVFVLFYISFSTERIVN